MIQERSAFDELLNALNSTVNCNNSHFQIQISNIDLICLGKANIIKLLNVLDKEVNKSF